MDENAVNFDSEANKQGPCHYGPSIQLLGDNPDTVDLGTPYVDPGVEALLMDGTPAPVVIDSSQINTDSIHTFQITYSTSNEHGSASVVRDVVVVLGMSAWYGGYTTTHSCDPLLFPVATDPAIIAGVNEGEVIIDNFFNLIGGSVTALVQDEYIVVPQQSVDITLGEIILDGLGEINSTGNQITIDYNFENTAPFIGGTGSCTVVYDKN